MTKKFWAVGIAFAVAATFVGIRTARSDNQEKPADKGKPAEAGKEAKAGGEGMPPMTKEEMEMMAKMMELGRPSKHHDHLKPMAGTWSLACKFKMDPKAPWSESKSTCKSEWRLDGRFLFSEIEGEMPGMGMFRGMAILGYDNAKQKYTSAWMDNMSTMVMTGTGTCSDDGKKITTIASYDCPMKGKTVTSRWVYTIKDNDHFTFEGFDTEQGGKEFQSMSIEYTRTKDAPAATAMKPANTVKKIEPAGAGHAGHEHGHGDGHDHARDHGDDDDDDR